MDVSSRDAKPRWMDRRRAMWVGLALLILILSLTTANTGGVGEATAEAATPAESEGPGGGGTIALLAGDPDGHPPGTHEYLRSARLVKHALLTSPNLPELDVRVYPGGWPEDHAELDEADTIVFITSGSDRVEAHHPILVGDRLDIIERQMDRGCGIMTFHYSTFAPMRLSEKILDWVGGHFDYQSGPGNGWFSAIRHYTAPVALGSPEHPVSRGVNPFEVHEEFYYSVRFREDDARRQDILLSQPPGEPRDYTVAWAIEREDGGRGFGLTGGHYYDNWWDADYRKLTLNAIVWTAGVEVPENGVEDVIAAEPLRALILTGHHHPGHDWRALTEGLQEVIELDPRTRVDVWEDVERLADESLEAYDVIVLNYNNWDRPGLSDPAKQRLIAYLEGGGGLSVIHFANGAFHKSLPNAESDWPEYRRMVRRVWDHQTNSGHDAHREFQVDITDESHPITDGLEPFVTRDELYYRQQGDEPIVPLVTAHSQDTNRDEPMAWAYNYGDGQIFQTVLGHDATAVRHAGDLIRRGMVWAAGHPQLGYDPVQPPVKMFSEGQFGEALDVAKGTATIASHDDLSQPPLTVEAWTQLRNSDGFNIIVASEDKGSGGHWELYSYAGSGVLSVFMPGYEPVEVRSSVNVADGQWHHVGMTFNGERVRLFVDGEQVADATVERNDLPRQPGSLTIGYTTHGDARVGSDGLIEQVRVRRGVHDVEPTGLMQPDDETVGLWRLEAVEDGRIPSGGSVKNAATLD